MKRKKSSRELARRRAARRERRRNIQPALPQTPKPGVSVPHWAMTGVLLASAALAGAPHQVFAQAPTHVAADSVSPNKRFDIPSGRLWNALTLFSRITGITVTDSAAVVGDIESPGVIGSLTPERALRRLLTGTGVTYRFANPRAVRLGRGALPQLATVAVVATRQAAVSSSKYTEPLRDVPQSITVVSNDLLAQQGVTSLRDAVRNVTGLTVNAGEGGSTPGDNFNIRGFSARSDIFVDGVRDAGGYSRETFNVEQIEVSKGPGSVFSGRGSTGGSINIVTKAPHPGGVYSGVLGAGNAQYARATVDVNQPVGAIEGSAVRLNAQWQNAGVAGVDEIRNKSWGVAPSLAFGLGTSTPITLSYFQNEQNNIPAYGLSNTTTDGPPPGSDPHKFFGLHGFDFEHVNAKQATGKITHDLGNGLTLRNQTSWGVSDVHRIVTQANTDGARRSPSHITYDQNLSNQSSLSSAFTTGGISHAVASGVELSHERSRFASYVFSSALPKIADLAHPNPDDVWTGTYKEGRPRRSAISNTLGIYTFDTMKLGTSLEVNVGLRWDSFSPKFKDSLDAPAPSRDSKAATWRAGAVYKPVERGSIYFAYGTSFNPTGELLAQDSRGTTGLDPEQNKSLEIGSKWELISARLLVSGALFRTDKTNARITDPADPAGTTLILAGQQRVDGAELSASGTLVEGWTLFAGYTYLDGKILHGTAGTDGTPLPNTPKNTLSIWSTGKLPWDVEIGGGVRFVDNRYRTATQSVPKYWAYDADAGYIVNRQVQLRLNLINLTDATYYDSGRFWVPAAGRSVKLSTSVTF